MTFRTKLLLISSFTMAGAVALVTGVVSASVRRAFERVNTERRTALLEQTAQELAARKADVARRVEQAAASVAVQQIISGAAEYDRAQSVAAGLELDYLDILDADGKILSSAHWPARFGYENTWGLTAEDRSAQQAFLIEVPQPDGSKTLSIIAVRRIAGGRMAVGGIQLGPQFLKSMGTAPGMRVLLLLPATNTLMDSQGTLSAEVTVDPNRALIQTKGAPEAFVESRLERSGITLGKLLAATSLKEEQSLERTILWTGLTVAATAIVLGLLLGWWTTERVTRPVAKLAEGARAVARGDWSTQVNVDSNDEFGELAESFNHMTRQLIEQKDRTVQAERVAAWRELARRLAHELKNPLFPLQITIENLERSRNGPDFDEVFQESTKTLLDELAHLKTIIGRFGDFAKMPAPQFAQVDLNQLVTSVMKLYEPRVPSEITLPSEPILIEADEDQLRRALGNLVLNALDAMPTGGKMQLEAFRTNGGARISVSDTGQGLTPEECSRLFTPYYTTKQHGTGLGLAIVQSVVSDHHGKIQVSSEPGKGTTFVIDLPERQS